MISETKTNTITRKGVQSEGQFQIKATGKAFRILSDGLYSDKIKAIIRELSCNAYDAHVDAGNLDTPFHVHLPNRLEPHFKIRDFGVGLSHSDVVNVYTTYFESTKTESNDYIGCLGLGSKSPFSYVDNFSIVSYLDGKKRIYNAFLNEEETPTIALLSEGDVDEPNGLEVSFPVQVNDINRFEEKSRSLFTYFKMRPKFTGAKVEVNEVEYILEGSNWGVRKTEYRGSARAVMGNVAYNLSDFSGDLNEDEKVISSMINNVPIDIIFEIGDLEVAASRENLSYNKRTIENIKKVLGKVAEEIRAKASDKIKGSKTLWEARVLAHEVLTGEYSHLSKVLEGHDVFEWNGIHLNGSAYMKLSDGIVKGTDLGLLCFEPKSSRRRRRSYNSTVGDPTITRSETTSIHSTKGTKVFWADISRGSHLRCRQVILESETISEGDRYNNCKKEIDRVYLVSGSKEIVEAFRKEIGIDKIEPISSIEKTKNSKVYKQAEYNPLNATKLLVYEQDESEHESWKVSTYWRKEKIDLDAGGIYVEIDRYKVNGENPSQYVDGLENHLETIGEDLKNITIVGAKASVAHKLDAHVGWKSLHVYVKELITAYVTDHKLAKKMNLAYEAHLFDTSNTRMQKLVATMKVDTSKPCGKFLECVKQFKKAVGDKETLIRLQRTCNRLMIDIKTEKSKVDLAEEWDAVEKAYPLLDDLDGWGCEKRKKDIEEYINALDMIKF